MNSRTRKAAFANARTIANTALIDSIRHATAQIVTKGTSVKASSKTLREGRGWRYLASFLVQSDARRCVLSCAGTVASEELPASGEAAADGPSGPWV
ncbi:hypothetical protein GCM10017056_52350 [Seohaeicola zhoushanensis]|uniref:Uncharacterized protein n=1 Tax=Seohaeicola zhoushanensis TaxID=1569283 RepID=A0A8J3MCJ8_9RHOB|nr:hypothetical protein GCM10017056_52350 [Seohaeicola zhoushanensis]